MQKILLLIFSILFYYESLSQDTQGFFLDDAPLKEAVAPAFVPYTKPTKSSSTFVQVNYNDTIASVSKYVYGNNANVYMTQMADQPVLLDHIKKVSPNVIRFPGGNISSVYFWNAEKNQPPPDAPSKLLEANGAEKDPGYWYGKNNEGWTMSVDSYYSMLEQTGSTGIITLNYGYARYGTAVDPVAQAAHLAAEWVRYDNGRTKFWEVGNESNGTWQAGHRINTANNQDGQPEIITGELYGQHFKVFADSMRKAAAETGATIYIGAQLLQEEPASWWNDTDKNWNDGIFQQAQNIPDYYIIHSYYTPFNTNSTPADILTSATTVTKAMMEYVTGIQQEAGVTVKPVALTEWNIFAVGSKQAASFVNGMHAALILGELIKNKYGLACRWDLANGWDSGNDHGMFNQGDEPGGTPKWNPRAVYYYMYYFQKFFGNHMVNASVSGSSDVIAYASKFNSGEAGIVVVNKGGTEQTVTINMQDFGYGERFYLYSLTGGTDNGQFSLKVSVNGAGPTFASGGPPNVASIPAWSAKIGEGVKFTAPPKSVQYILIEEGNNVITGTEKHQALDVHVYPNPGHDSIQVEFPSGEFSKIEITDIRGKVTHQEEVRPGQTSMRLNKTLASGIYIFRAYAHGKMITTKIIIE
jgi:hypothetical protein